MERGSQRPRNVERVYELRTTPQVTAREKTGTSALHLQDTGNSMRFRIRVIPRASRKEGNSADTLISTWLH